MLVDLGDLISGLAAHGNFHRDLGVSTVQVMGNFFGSFLYFVGYEGLRLCEIGQSHIQLRRSGFKVAICTSGSHRIEPVEGNIRYRLKDHLHCGWSEEDVINLLDKYSFACSSASVSLSDKG
jgi:hypothetical protein